MYSECTTTITVVEKSRYPPTVFPLHVTVFSYRTAYKGGIIGKINALDKDRYDTLHYSISSSASSSRYRTNNDQDYFDVDNEDGTMVAVTPLDSGTYHVNVTVSDGKFRRSVDVSVAVVVLTQAMIDNAVVLRLGPLSPEEFIEEHKELLVKAIAAELFLSEQQINVVSMKANVYHDLNEDNTIAKQNNKGNRARREISESLDVLVVIEKATDVYYTRNETLSSLQGRLDGIRSRTQVRYLHLMESMCISNAQCSGNGDCIDVIEVKDDIVMPLNTRLSSVVSPVFEQKFGCACHQGFDGQLCEDLVNACGHKPCFSYQICAPTDLIAKGYMCHCRVGYAGKQCEINISKCNSLSCYYPVRPLSFKSESYAQYSIPHQDEASSLQLSMYIRTRHPVGVINYAAGSIDYTSLEVVDGHIQYRWDCGSGEGVVRSSARVDDNKWHFVNLTRQGTRSVLSLDGMSTSSVAPGENDVLNVDSDYMFLGAKVTGNTFSPNVDYGFVGCIDEVTFGGYKLPLTLTSINSREKTNLKRFVNIELSCPDNLPLPGICGSHPCVNGGTCSEINKTTYQCNCSQRYSGKHCEIDNAPCSSSPCLNEGICLVVGNSYTCNCPTKLSGKRCEYGRFCNPNPCINGGRCEEGSSGPICKCYNFSGDRCQNDINECRRNPCQNGGTCFNFYGGFKCLCPSQATGEYCSDLISSRSGYTISLEELFVILAVFLAFALIIIIVLAWQRRRWKQRKQQQNNRVRLTAHVKNDLKSVDRPHRNSKICNVEADQVSIFSRNFSKLV